MESLKQQFPDSRIDFLLRKGNEVLLDHNPHVRHVIAWNKRSGKYRSMLRVISQIRKIRYDEVFSLQRFATSGFMAWRSRATSKTGFSKNPFSFCYSTKVKHAIGNGRHEVERNHDLIRHLTKLPPAKPMVYFDKSISEKVQPLTSEAYYVVAPASVWFTKQFPIEKWTELVKQLDKKVYFIGSKDDHAMCGRLADLTANSRNLCGQLNLLESAALISNSRCTIVNDSAPLHLASATNAPTVALFCSTTPRFGFGPLADRSRVVEIDAELDCRPCGLHGYKSCPKGHFKCGHDIKTAHVVDAIRSVETAP